MGAPSSRKIEQSTYHSVPFRVPAADQHPDHEPIADFRKRRLRKLAGLFVQALRLRRSRMGKIREAMADSKQEEVEAQARRAYDYGRQC